MKARSLWFAVLFVMFCGCASLRGFGQGTPANAIPTVEGDAAPRLIKMVKPVYPGIAITDQSDGDVVMSITVATDGSVRNVQVVHGLPQLIRAAVHAVSQWQYEPYRVNGVATEVKTTATVHFKITPNPIGVADSAAMAVGVTTGTPSAKPVLPPPPAGVLRISGRVMANMVDKKVNPVYPPDSVALDARGTVVMLATIKKTGEVSDVQVVSGPERFRDAATTAVMQWRYHPYEVDGEAVDVQTTVALDFAPPSH